MRHTAFLSAVFVCVFVASEAQAGRDLSEIKKSGKIRFLVPAAPDYLPRVGDPVAAEIQLAQEFADKLDLKAEFIPVEERSRFLDMLEANEADVVVASLA